MKINQIDNNSFNAIYRIKNTPQNYEAIEKNIIPLYEQVKNSAAMAFPGNNPWVAAVNIVIKDIASKNNATVEWVKENAKIHDLDIKTFNDDFLHVITTEEDLNKVFGYMKKNDSTSNLLVRRIKMFFKPTKLNSPKHLHPLEHAINLLKKNYKGFDDILGNNTKIQNVETWQELIFKMAQE